MEIVIKEKLINDNKGIVTKPNHSMNLIVQENPVAHALDALGVAT